MLTRLFTSLAMFCLVTAPIAVRAADPKAAAPDVVVRLQSIDGLLHHAKYIAGLAGQEESFKQMEGMIKAKAGPKGLEGIDTKRPFGLYATIAPNLPDSKVVVLIPISDENAALALLKNLDIKAEKGKDGVYAITVNQAPIPIFLRFANKYAYITFQTQDALAQATLLDPGTVLALAPKAVASVTVQIDKIPDNLKQMGIQQLELGLANLKDKKEKGETEAAHKLKGAMIDMISGALVSVIKEGGETELRIDIDQKTNDLTVEFTLAGKPNSKLSASIAGLGQAPSLVGGMIGKDSAMSMVAHGTLPEELRKAFGEMIDADVPKSLEKEKDPVKRELVAKAMKSFQKSFKTGEIDMVVDLRGPSQNKLYSMLMGMKLTDGLELEKVMREAVKQMKPEDQAKAKLDADQVGGVKIHRFEGPKDDKEFAKNFGNNPIYVAFRPDAAVVGIGDNGLNVVKEALAAKAGAAGLFRMEASVSRLLPLGKDVPGMPKSAEAMLAKEKDGDKIVLTVEGGKALKLSLNVKMTLVKLINEMQKGTGTAKPKPVAQ